MAAASALPPGGQTVAVADEIARTAPVIAALRAAGVTAKISIDTRKAPVARAALQAGADIVNDVAALTFDPALGPLVAETQAPVVLMHHLGTPETMQADPRYDDVLLDVYDWLAESVASAERLGIPRNRITVDPGIGFGKTPELNWQLLEFARLVPEYQVMIGYSRKRFLGEQRMELAPNLAAGKIAIAAGAAYLRVHDVAGHQQLLY